MDRLFTDVPPGSIDFVALVDEFIKSCAVSGNSLPFKKVLLAYRQSRPTLAKTARLLHFIARLPKDPTFFQALEQCLEDWICTEQQVLSCLQDESPDAIRNAGIDVSILLEVLKPVLLSFNFIRMQSEDPRDIACADAGKAFVVFTLHQLNAAVTPSILPVNAKHDRIATDKAVFQMALNIIKDLLCEINTLPPNLTPAQVIGLHRSKEFINLLLLGPNADGSGFVSHYDIIVTLPGVYGPFVRGTFAQNVHWTMEKFVNELGKRRRHLAFLMMPPDASWPLICQMSRRHEYNNLTTRASYHLFEGDLVEFVKEGNSCNIYTNFRDMLFQRASLTEFEQWGKSPQITAQLRRAMVAKVRDTVRCIQHHCHSNRRYDHPNEEPSRQDNHHPAGVKIDIPSNIDLWELMIETADQLYSFVETGLFSYEDILDNFYDLVYKPENKLHLSKDNSLVWLLLQLLLIFKQDKQHKQVPLNTAKMDVENDGRLFDKLVRLYNEEQIVSKDAFTLRDFSLACTFDLLEKELKPNRSSIKQRHPGMVAHAQYSNDCYKIQNSFKGRCQHYLGKESKSEPTTFSNPDPFVISEVALASQSRIEMCSIFYSYMIPFQTEKDCLGNPMVEFYKGGTLPYNLLDMLSISFKYWLLRLLHEKMIRNTTGPQYPTELVPLPCVPPHILDVFYKLLYSTPCKVGLVVKDLLKTVQSQDKAAQGIESVLKWLSTILQFMNYRLARYLKYSPMSSSLLHDVRHLISQLEHRQVYKVLETFTMNIIHFQIDVKVLRSLGSLSNSSTGNEYWFAESEMLARSMVMTTCRLVKIRGQSDIKTDELFRVLTGLYPYKLDWSQKTLDHFPDVIRRYYTGPNNQLSPRRPIHASEIEELARNGAFLVNESHPGEELFTQHFKNLDVQSSLLCVLWKIALDQRSMEHFDMASARRLLLLIPPSRMATHVVDLCNYILSMTSDMTNHLLETMIWKNQWVDFNQVLRALLGGNQSLQQTNDALCLIRFLLLESYELKRRVAKWNSLQFSHRYWTEVDFTKKLLLYLAEYPEYHEFEAPLRDRQSLDPPLQPPMPTYYANVISDFLLTFEVVIARLVEHEQTELLVDILDEYGPLFYYHQHPLAFVSNTFVYYCQSSALQNPRVRKRLLRLLDFGQYDIAPEAIEYARNEIAGGSLFDAGYFERVIHKLSMRSNPRGCAPRTKPGLPERHFREICNPALEAVTIATLEIMVAPVPPSAIIRSILDFALQRESCHVGVSAHTIHSIGLLMSTLPPDTFIRPVWEELNQLILTDPHLLEASEPSRLIRCGVPRWVNHHHIMSQSASDMTMIDVLGEAMTTRRHRAMIFPYIFNDYTFNLHNYSTNAPNTFLTLIHSILHYSSLDAFYLFLEYIKALRTTGKLHTDVQLLYVCALLGPALHRIEKLGPVDNEFSIELMDLVKQVTTRMDMKSGWSTQALEQVFDFLYYIRARFVKPDERGDSQKTGKMIWDIIRTMNETTSLRLLRLIS